MECLPASALHQLLEVLVELSECGDETLLPQLLAALPRLIPCDHASYNVVDPVHARHCGRVTPPDGITPSLLQCFEHHLTEHPVLAYYRRTGDDQALRLADFLSQRELHRLGLWADFYRPMHVEHQLAAALPARRPLVVGLALGRERSPFTDQERALLELARPHLAALLRQAELRTLLAQGLAATGWEVVRLGPDGSVREASDRADRLLATYTGAHVVGDRRLPASLADWHRQRAECVLDAPSVAPTLVFSSAEGHLIVRLLAGGAAGGDDLLVLHEQPSAIPPRVLGGYGLSRREAEVAAAVADGLTNDAVARRLGIRAGTVEKHLTHAYGKLGLANRTALAAWVRQVTLDRGVQIT